MLYQVLRVSEQLWLQKVSVILWSYLNAITKPSVSVIINLRCGDSVCLYSVDFVSGSNSRNRFNGHCMRQVARSTCTSSLSLFRYIWVLISITQLYGGPLLVLWWWGHATVRAQIWLRHSLEKHCSNPSGGAGQCTKYFMLIICLCLKNVLQERMSIPMLGATDHMKLSRDWFEQRGTLGHLSFWGTTQVWPIWLFVWKAWRYALEKSIFCCADFGSTIALGLQQR